MIFMGKSGWFPVSRFSLKSTHYQRVKHPIKSHRTTIFPWFSYGFPWLKVGPKTALNPLRGDLHVEVCGGSDPEFVAGGQMAMGQNLCHIWVVIHIHKSHPSTIYFDVHERCQGFDPLSNLVNTQLPELVLRIPKNHLCISLPVAFLKAKADSIYS